MEGPRNEVTLEEFKVFYGIDREVYTILVRDLCRNPSESLQIMGFWLWIERQGFSNFISKIFSLAPYLINEVADEALTCLKVIHNHSPLSPTPTPADVPLTCSLAKSEALLCYVNENRLSVYHSIQIFLSDVYIPVLSDIMEKARHGETPASNSIANVPPSPDPEPLARRFSGLRIGNNNSARENEVQKFGRTMFATFSKGYPVSEGEVKKYFETRFGKCIEYIQMHDPPRNEQSLYAKILFRRPCFISAILDGETKAKFTINGKHVWIRQFIQRNGKLLPCGCPNMGRSACPHHH